MIVTGIKHIVFDCPLGRAQFNEGNEIPDHLLPYVSEGDKQYLKPIKKARKSAEPKSE